jgi:glycosyltransferase involved in cell wall biosynthesis
MSQKTIYINGRFLTQPATGVQRFALELLTALDHVYENDPKSKQIARMICLIPKRIKNLSLPEWKNIPIQKCGRLGGNLWEQIELPFFARKGLLVNLCNIGPVFHFNQIVVFHDASVFAVPQAYSFTFKIKYRLIMWVLGHTARQVLTDSYFSQEELAHYLKIRKNKIIVIPGGCEHVLNIDPDYSIINNRLAQTPFLLAVGSSSPHKNLAIVVRTFERYQENLSILVIAGGTFSKVFTAVDTTETPRTIRLGYISNAQLRALYSRAVGFIFPSIYEGFGLPPLEAMACGCPVICSNRASMPEVCGDAALYFDPLNEADIHHSITMLLENSSLQDSLREKGFERVKRFTWKNSAESLLEILGKTD